MTSSTTRPAATTAGTPDASSVRLTIPCGVTEAHHHVRGQAGSTAVEVSYRWRPARGETWWTIGQIVEWDTRHTQAGQRDPRALAEATQVIKDVTAAPAWLATIAHAHLPTGIRLITPGSLIESSPAPRVTPKPRVTGLTVTTVAYHHVTNVLVENAPPMPVPGQHGTPDRWMRPSLVDIDYVWRLRDQQWPGWRPDQVRVFGPWVSADGNVDRAAAGIAELHPVEDRPHWLATLVTHCLPTDRQLTAAPD